MSSRPELLQRLHDLLLERLGSLARERIGALAGRLEHISDPALRRGAFLRGMAAEPAEVAVEMLAGLERMVTARRPEAQKLFLDLLDSVAVRSAFSPERLAEIWRLGRLRGYRRMLEIFFCSGPEDGRLAEQPPLPPDIRDIPLGRRKALARLPAIGMLERLLADTDVAVIRNLLANPRITETEVVHLVARRPASPAVLAEVAANRRWVSRYAVKKALVYNPETPVSISVPLLKFLLRSDLRELAEFTSTNALIKREAGSLLQRRGTRR